MNKYGLMLNLQNGMKLYAETDDINKIKTGLRQLADKDYIPAISIEVTKNGKTMKKDFELEHEIDNAQ